MVRNDSGGKEKDGNKMEGVEGINKQINIQINK
jgi:hypothetical protein